MVDMSTNTCSSAIPSALHATRTLRVTIDTAILFILVLDIRFIKLTLLARSTSHFRLH